MDESKKKKPIFKKWWFWVLVILIVVGYGAASTQTGDSEPKEDTNISMAEFNSLETGMTYEQAVSIIGCEGTVASQSEVMGIKMVIYSWVGNGTTGSNANATFQNNSLIAKAQIGLR